MDNVRPNVLGMCTSLTSAPSRIDNRDYIILYAPTGQSGETTFFLPSNFELDMSNAPAVLHSASNGTLTLNYELGVPNFVEITLGSKSVVAIIMDKSTASQWHAPDIPGQGVFGQYFSIGTNQRSVYLASPCASLCQLENSVLVGGPYLVRSAAISGSTLSLVSSVIASVRSMC